jgi:hypothetical protein
MVSANNYRCFIMPDYSLVPVDYQPNFDGYSLVPVDYDPFAADGVTQQAQIQQAQAQPQGPPQQQPATGAGQPDAGAPAAGGVLSPLTENGRLDSYVYGKNSTGIPPTGPQVTTANGNLTITATDNAKPTNFGGIYGHTLTFSEPGSNKLATMTTVDPTGLLVATPIEGDPSNLNVSEYKGY